MTLLVATPEVEGPVALVEGAGARWAYADQRLEGLTASQKQLLRMGPENVDKMLVWLRALQGAIQ